MRRENAWRWNRVPMGAIVALLLALTAAGPLAQEQRAPVVVQEDDNRLRGVLRAGAAPLVHEILIPDDTSGAEIVLQIQSPDELDLDLEVWDQDPSDLLALDRENITDEEYLKLEADGVLGLQPVDSSDGIGDTELCRVERPESGRVWAVVHWSGGEGRSIFYLEWEFLSGAAVAAEAIRPGQRLPVTPGAGEYRLPMYEDELAVLVLDTTSRKFSVSTADGSRLTTHVAGGSQHVALGEPFERSQVLLTKLSRPKDFLVEVDCEREPGEPPSTGAQQPCVLTTYESSLTVVPGGESGGTGFLVPFSENDVSPWPLKRRDKGTFSGSVPDGGRVIYRLPSSSVTEITIASSESDLDLAVCDSFGMVLQIHGDTVVTRTSPRYEVQSVEPTIGQYLVVFPSAFADQNGGGFKLTVNPIFKK